MDNKAGVLLAFALGSIVGYKWPAIKKALTPLASLVDKTVITPLTSLVEKEVVRGYLAVKDGICGVPGHFRKVAKEVAGAKA